jgi:Mg2+-importing ATPase
LLQQLGTTSEGLSQEEARQRLKTLGPNLLQGKPRAGARSLLLAQFKSPIILILIGAALLSFYLKDRPDAVIILIIVGISGLLGFWQEKGAAEAVQKLLTVVKISAAVIRENQETAIPVAEVVPGDIIVLRAGAIIPGDCLILASKDLFVDEATLTGETFPVEKAAGLLPADTPLARRQNSLFMGTNVVNGSARAVVAKTGTSTEFGQIAGQLRLRPPLTEFERGVRRFGFLLMEVTTILLLLIIFAGNVFLKRPVLDSFLFALALAVGLTPQLLPAIISVNLASGAKRMAKSKVIVRRLAAIENFGSMTVLCSDKTGTLTEGNIHIHHCLDLNGQDSEKVCRLAYLNASFEAGVCQSH